MSLIRAIMYEATEVRIWKPERGTIHARVTLPHPVAEDAEVFGELSASGGDLLPDAAEQLILRAYATACVRRDEELHRGEHAP